MMSILYDDEVISRCYEARLRREITEQVTEQVTEKVTEQVTEQVTEKITEQGIKLLIETCQPAGITFTAIVEKVQNGYNLTEKEAKMLVKKFWPSEPTSKH